MLYLFYIGTLTLLLNVLRNYTEIGKKGFMHPKRYFMLPKRYFHDSPNTLQSASYIRGPQLLWEIMVLAVASLGHRPIPFDSALKPLWMILPLCSSPPLDPQGASPLPITSLTLHMHEPTFCPREATSPYP